MGGAAAGMQQALGRGSLCCSGSDALPAGPGVDSAPPSTPSAPSPPPQGVSLRLGAEGRLAVKLAAEVEAAALIQLVNARAARRAELRRRAGAGAATAGDCSR